MARNMNMNKSQTNNHILARWNPVEQFIDLAIKFLVSLS